MCEFRGDGFVGVEVGVRGGEDEAEIEDEFVAGVRGGGEADGVA